MNIKRRNIIGITCLGSMLPINTHPQTSNDYEMESWQMIPPPQRKPASNSFIRDWNFYKNSFIKDNGQSMDTFMKVTHSEGQGWSMVFAQHAGDRETFDRIYVWTKDKLIRPDGLFSWKWDDKSPIKIDDPNNATDGDLHIAMALIRAGQEWNRADYLTHGRSLARIIHRKLVKKYEEKTYLMPGVHGFEHSNGLLLNPSYYNFAAIRTLANAFPHRDWINLEKDGLDMISIATYGRFNLPPDWIRRSKDGFNTNTGRNHRFGYDAMRVPLYMVWSGFSNFPVVINSHNFWKQTKMPWTEFREGFRPPYRPGNGVNSISALVQHKLENKPIIWPDIRTSDNYYQASLQMLSRMAFEETS